MKLIGKTFFSAFCALLVVTFAESGKKFSKELKPVLYINGKTVAHVVLADDGTIARCTLQELEEESDASAIVESLGLPVKYPTFKSMMKLIKDCSQYRVPSVHHNDSDIAIFQDGTPASTTTPPIGTWSLLSGIAPGTKWCGINDIASNFDDLGVYSRADACCRTHDNCPVKLKSFRSGYGLFNFALYTKSHCDCDYELHGCLKEAKDEIADTIGNIFFNLMKIQCLKNVKSFICLQNRTEVDGSQNCIRWGEDVNNNKMQSVSIPIKY